MEERDWTRHMKLRHLHVFAAVARHKSLTGAAAELRVTQPALSKWLRELESQVGSSLFERGRELKLRPTGQLLLRHVNRVIGELSRARDEMTAARRGHAGSLRVGTVFGPASIMVPRAVIKMRETAPSLAIFLYEDTLDRLLPRLQERELDLVVCRLEEQALNASMAYEALYRDPAIIVARTGHPLARKRRLTWREAHEYSWILPAVGSPMRLRLEALFAHAGLPLPARRIESVSPIVNLMLVSKTDHLAVMSRDLAREFGKAGLVCLLPLTIEAELGPVGMLWIDGPMDPAIAGFLDCLRSLANKTQGAQQTTARLAGVRS